ncbi:hypothetical protein OH76DRAFT_831994 [Lentinus brumalis]|uniref:Uncharacterized protein n=1 Tax=Lentinus brumalis TaxID=2498619 RepID=A0A371D1W9_9APHY|nr:hypothetical protein OH76DRAFT_831994 [Polyporus brumalis]
MSKERGLAGPLSPGRRPPVSASLWLLLLVNVSHDLFPLLLRLPSFGSSPSTYPYRIFVFLNIYLLLLSPPPRYPGVVALMCVRDARLLILDVSVLLLSACSLRRP